jgi:hypothetical protein
MPLKANVKFSGGGTQTSSHCSVNIIFKCIAILFSQGQLTLFNVICTMHLISFLYDHRLIFIQYFLDKFLILNLNKYQQNLKE